MAPKQNSKKDTREHGEHGDEADARHAEPLLRHHHVLGFSNLAPIFEKVLKSSFGGKIISADLRKYLNFSFGGNLPAALLAALEADGADVLGVVVDTEQAQVAEQLRSRCFLC